MRLRKGIVLKAAYVEPMRMVHGTVTNSPGLARLSHQARLNAVERDRQHKGEMAVALAQPHRGNVYDESGNLVASADDRRLGTALGRFCARHKPRPLAPWLYDAGEEYAGLVYRYKRAMTFKTFMNSSDSLAPTIDDETGAVRREKVEMDKRRVDSDLAGVHRKGPAIMELVCFEDKDKPTDWDVPGNWADILVACLDVASRHFGMAPKNIRDIRYED